MKYKLYEFLAESKINYFISRHTRFERRLQVERRIYYSWVDVTWYTFLSNISSSKIIVA